LKKQNAFCLSIPTNSESFCFNKTSPQTPLLERRGAGGEVINPHIMEHQEKHFKGSQTVRDIVIGMSDGLTVPFALTAGLTGAVTSNMIVITAGLAEIVAGSIAMGMGGYLAGKTDYDHYFAEEKREYDEVKQVPEIEKKEVMDILAAYGISEKNQKMFTNELIHDRKKWVDFMMRFELGLEEPELSRARKSALTIALSYIGGGLIPLFSYFFTPTPLRGLVYSIFITLLALLGFGYFKSAMTGQKRWAGALKTAVIGAIAAGAAFFIAYMIAK
jgi:VIT1/CCC1 family predicted Fe2+/Mn2+ transporter